MSVRSSTQQYQYQGQYQYQYQRYESVVSSKRRASGRRVGVRRVWAFALYLAFGQTYLLMTSVQTFRFFGFENDATFTVSRLHSGLTHHTTHHTPQHHNTTHHNTQSGQSLFGPNLRGCTHTRMCSSRTNRDGMRAVH